MSEWSKCTYLKMWTSSTYNSRQKNQAPEIVYKKERILRRKEVE